MILEEETFKKFGYFSTDLSLKSSKKILVACDVCGIIREISKSKYRRLCFRCAMDSKEVRKKMSEGQKGEKSHNFGKHISPEAIEKIRKSLVGKFDGEKNPMFGKHHSKEARRKMSENHVDFKGENSPSWKGGVSYEPYCILFNNEFKERVREYWDRKCVVCRKNEIENGRKLDVHHVTYNKESCCDDSIPLFLPLCIKCHHKVHGNEDFWLQEFKRIIYSRNIDGKCYYSKEEMKFI